MNPSEQEIESVLRHAPQHKPPAGLKTELMAQVKLSVARSESQASVGMPAPGGWLRRWWPALSPATVSMVCVVVLAVQQMEIRDLRKTVRTLSQGAPTTETSPPVTTPQTSGETSSIEPPANEQQEIVRLKQLVGQLTAEVAQLEQMRKENERLRAQLATLRGLTAEELDALAKARERALAVQCVNNMKQLGLAAHIWANDKNDVFPPEILSMTNEMNMPIILVCPAETNRQAAVNWASYTSANCSYEYLAPSGNSTEPTRVLFRCPIHGNIGLCDGSVHGGAAKNHPDWFSQRDEKLYYEPKAHPARPTQP